MRMSGGHSKASRAADASDLSRQEPSAEAPGSSPHHRHPIRNSLPYGCADSVRLRITGTAQETLTEPERVRPGEESGTAHTHSRLHPASREQTLLRSRGVMSAPPSAPPPDIRQQSSCQPTHHAADSQNLLEACCRSPQRGQRYPGVRQPAPQSATHSGWSERGRCALTDASSPLPSSPTGGSHRSSPGHRYSARLRRPQTLRPKRKTAAAPPHRPVRSAHSPDLSLFGLCYYYYRHLRRYFVNDISILPIVFTFPCVLWLRILWSAIFLI